jgi:hypothetical protein
MWRLTISRWVSQAHSEYSEQMKLNELMSSDNNEAASVFLKQDIMHMTVLNRTGTQLQHSSVPRMGLFDALRSMVNNDAVTARRPRSAGERVWPTQREGLGSSLNVHTAP